MAPVVIWGCCACEKVIGKRPRVMSDPPGLFRFSAKVAGWMNPRMGDLLEFAPKVGGQKLEEHFRSIVS